MAVYFGQLLYRYCATVDDIMEHGAGTDARQLVCVADKDDTHLVRHGLQKGFHKLDIKH